MALVKGINCGFVTVAPTTDPNETATQMDSVGIVTKHTSPTNATKITEIGWWCDNATPADEFEVGLYSNDGDADISLYGSGPTAKGTTSGWKKVTGLNISISPSTIYWIAAQLDNTSPNTNSDMVNTPGESRGYRVLSSLPNPWGSSVNFVERLHAIYAVYEGALTKNIKETIGWDASVPDHGTAEHPFYLLSFYGTDIDGTWQNFQIEKGNYTIVTTPTLVGLSNDLTTNEISQFDCLTIIAKGYNTETGEIILPIYDWKIDNTVLTV